MEDSSGGLKDYRQSLKSVWTHRCFHRALVCMHGNVSQNIDNAYWCCALVTYKIIHIVHLLPERQHNSVPLCFEIKCVLTSKQFCTVYSCQQ